MKYNKIKAALQAHMNIMRSISKKFLLDKMCDDPRNSHNLTVLGPFLSMAAQILK